MTLTCTLAQAVAVKNMMTAPCCMWVRNVEVSTRVDELALCDTKLGHIIITFASEADKPTVTQVTTNFASNAEVASISPN